LSQLDKKYFLNISGLSFNVLKINQGKDDVEDDKEIIDGMMGLNLHE
jgi:hypothetical protein